MEALSFNNPVFATYAAAAALMILLGIATAWITVIQMLRVNGGFRAPEDMKKTPINPNPKPDQTAPNEAVERYRRIMQNHLENLPFFCTIGLLFVLTQPTLAFAQWLLWTPPKKQGVKSGISVVGCCHLSGLLVQRLAAGPYGSSRIGSTSAFRARTRSAIPWFSDPVLPTVLPYPPSTTYASRRPLTPVSAYAATGAGAL